MNHWFKYIDVDIYLKTWPTRVADCQSFKTSRTTSMLSIPSFGEPSAREIVIALLNTFLIYSRVSDKDGIELFWTTYLAAIDLPRCKTVKFCVIYFNGRSGEEHRPDGTTSSTIELGEVHREMNATWFSQTRQFGSGITTHSTHFQMLHHTARACSW